MTNQPILHNIRILDFTWVLAGPYATRLLADFGAEVIKVQPLIASEAEDRFACGYYNTWNRNKLGITLNLNKPQGVALAKKLVGISDAVIENFTPRVMANWGLDYANLGKIKPDIIMLSMSTMGSTGPWRDYTGFGPTVQAFSGITCLTSYPGEPPSGLGYSYADHVAGLMAALALLGAIEYRHRTGEGQYIDISQ
ncbi:CoA transferase, partial [Chloroflexota bacterium]